VTAVVRDQDVVAGAVLRVWAGDQVVGGAFLVAPDLVATAATVVAGALGVHPGTEEHPTGTMRLDFPLLRAEPGRPVRVAGQVERWSPAAGTALLRLADAVPPAVRMPPLRRVEPLDGRSFSVLGFPAGLADGVWTTGRMEAREDGLRHRLHAASGEQPVDAGFSGAPVWEARSGAVAGMVVDRRGGAAELVPIDEVLGLDPERLPCPYLGLRTFDEAQAATFFGRDDDIERLVDLMARRPVVAVAGPSGAGKSSLVRAGLVPRLRAAGAEIVYLRAEPGARLQESLPEADDRDLVLVIDQFEELAALDPVAARDLLEAVVRRTDPGSAHQRSGRPVRAVLTLRWTTLDEMLTPELIDTLDAGTVLVGPLDRAGLQEAIVRPAERPPGLAFEQGLVETILDDAGAEPGRLPLVESLLADLWERRDGGFLTLRDYEAAGGVAGALAEHAEAVAGALPSDADAALRRLVTALARPDRDGRFVRRPMPLDQLPEAQRALVPALTAGRLLIVSPSARGTDVVEFAHQALVDHWPRLRSWLAADRDFLAWREQVGVQRERWEAESRADPALLRGVLLARASEWLPAREDDVPRADLDYLRRSRARERREVRRWRIVTAVVAVLTLSAAVLGVISVRSGDQIAAQLATANADALGREAQARNPDDPATAAQLALAAWREDPRNPQARTALAQSYVAMRTVERELPGLTGAPITDMLVGGDTAILVADPHPIVVTGLSGPAPQYRELTGVAADRQLAVSPDGRRLAAQTPDRTVLELHDLMTGAPPVPLPRLGGTEVGLPRFSPDSERLAYVTLDSAGVMALRIRDVRTGTDVPHGVRSLPADTNGVVLTPGSDRVVVRRGDPRSPDSRLVVLSLTDGAELATLPTGARSVLGGAAVATCELGQGGPDATDTLVVTPFDGSAPRRTGLITRCGGSPVTSAWLSGNGLALVEKEAGRTLRITDLRTAEAFRITAPVELPSVSLSTFGTTPTFDVLPAAHGPRAVLAGGSALLWLRADPPPAAAGLGPGERIDGIADDFHLVRTRDGFYTSENGTGRRLGELSGVTDRNSLAAFDPPALWNARLAAGGWDLTQYELPALRPASRILLPSRDGGTPPGDRGHPPMISLLQEPPEDGGRLIAVADGVLTAWDPASGLPAGAPVPLGTTDLQIGFHRSYPDLHLRPGHPGQVGVLTPGEVQIWDVALGRLVAAVPAVASLDPLERQGSPIAFDPTGDRLAVLGRDHAVQLWDIGAAQQVRAPIPAPGITGLVGFDLDGYLVVVDGDSTRERLAFVELDAGAESGSVDADSAIRPLDIAHLGDDRRTLRLEDLPRGWVADLPVTAKGWRDGLCAAVGRPFTPGEQAILPPGADTAPPCS
jgi:WD40 repeat protein